jgi:hypothetical protein
MVEMSPGLTLKLYKMVFFLLVSLLIITLCIAYSKTFIRYANSETRVQIVCRLGFLPSSPRSKRVGMDESFRSGTAGQLSAPKRFAFCFVLLVDA